MGLSCSGSAFLLRFLPRRFTGGSMRLRNSAIALFLCVASPCSAIDDTGYATVYGFGSSSCGRFIDDTSSHSSSAPQNKFNYKVWLGGYVTATDSHLDHIKDILKGTDLNGAMLWLEDYCRAHRLETFVEAVRALELDRMDALLKQLTQTEVVDPKEGNASAAAPESVQVKYRGPVSLASFKCDTVTRSRFIQRVCYDAKNAYMLINLNGTWYHYCEIDQATVSNLLTAELMRFFYNASIKGNFDCQTHRVPAY
jgi:hypothetical protein